MRVTNSMMVNRMMMNMNRNLSRMGRIYEDYSTGKKIHRPSDDPVLVARSMKLHTDIAENAQFKKNINDVDSMLDKTETSLTELNSVLLRVRELTVQASNGVLTKEDTINIKAEIDQLKEEITKISNDTYVGRHIYSGYKTDKPYMNENGSYNLNMEKQIKTDNLRFPIDIKDPNNTFEMDIAGLKDENGIKYTGKYQVELEAKEYKNIEEIQQELEKQLNSSIGSEGITSIEIKQNDPLVSRKKEDNALTEEESVSIVFDKELEASSKDIIQDKVNKAFGDGKATVSIASRTVGSKTVSEVTITPVAGEKLDLTGGKDLVFKSSELNTDSDINIRLMDSNTTIGDEKNNSYFKVDIDNNSLVIENKYMQDDQKFAIRIDNKDLKDQLGLEKLNICESNEKVKYNVGISTDLDVNVRGDQVFGAVVDTDNDGIGDKTIMDTMDDLINNLEKGDTEKISKILDEVDGHRENISRLKSEIGARSNTAETIKNRIDQTEVNFTKLLSQTEDTDLGKASMEFMNLKSVYDASLNVGARIIQQTLVDFIR
ncbi:flagellar hook-associated protein FlgL [Tepidibacter hydrothermalis]|uniref:Flagellar hook-associated protein FlgL n=1 Tax=Tepidibacter hydrothermalis TaxID=3036126 RepID=A0ABY8EAR3_9FIRM|nr:flagellar hook-associated protein FlgL [Tepidibacter hydrothermalis]WFD10041.1 flagellar hook-associated protein FlgL [Tepidibacter hydrothermalis]